MKDLKTIESRVRVILANHKEARDDDMILYLLYCNRYGEVKIGELPFEMVMNNYKVFHIFTISRNTLSLIVIPLHFGR